MARRTQQVARQRGDVEANVIGFRELGMGDVERVGGKNASLGEMIRHLAGAGVRVPDGFATTASAYRTCLSHDGLHLRIQEWLAKLDVDDVKRLAETGAKIREAVLKAPFPADLEHDIHSAFQGLAGTGDIAVAVRSS